MAKVTYASLKLKASSDTKTFNFLGTEIEVLKYLPISEKYDLIMISLQEAYEKDGIINPVKLDIHFHLNILFMYTNLTFTEKQKEDLLKLYDTVQSTGLLDGVIRTMEDSEYNMLKLYMDEVVDQERKYKTTALYLVENLINQIPNRIDELQEMLKDYDLSKMQNVVDFAKAINGGRDIVE